MLPMMLTISAVTGVSPIPTPIGSAPLNSMTGTIDMNSVHSIFPIVVLVIAENINGLYHALLYTFKTHHFSLINEILNV